MGLPIEIVLSENLGGVVKALVLDQNGAQNGPFRIQTMRKRLLEGNLPGQGLVFLLLHNHGEGGRHFGVKLRSDGDFSQALDGLVELDLAPFDNMPLGF